MFEDPLILLYGAMFVGVLLMVEGIYYLVDDLRGGPKANINRRLRLLDSSDNSPAVSHDGHTLIVGVNVSRGSGHGIHEVFRRTSTGDVGEGRTCSAAVAVDRVTLDAVRLAAGVEKQLAAGLRVAG